MMFDIMTPFAKKTGLQPSHQTGDHYNGKTNVADLVIGAKYKKNTISLHGILPTHVYAKFKTD